jgi:hypothetical protein
MLDTIGFAQRKRLAFIDFCLMFNGTMYRQDIINKFGVGLSAASCDIKMYTEIAPANLLYNNKNKRYYPTGEFKPVIKFDAHGTLVKLARNILDSFENNDDMDFPVITPAPLNSLDVNIVASIIQSITNNKIIDVTYTSETSIQNGVELSPHSVFYSGLNWYLRAFERKLGAFSDFALNRITDVIYLPVKVTEKETKMADHQWMTFVDLYLIPHPKNARRPDLIQKDFNMKNGVLVLNTRAATVGYLLQHWNVDCSKDTALVEDRYQLSLRNVDALVDVKSMKIAPGFKTADVV